MAGGAGNDVLIGLAGADILSGGDGNDSLEGGVGGDVMIGGAGNDSYRVDDANDFVAEAGGTAGGIDTVISRVNYVLPANVERLSLFAPWSVNGTGNALANTIVGNNFTNVLNGGLGNDILAGGNGTDRFLFNTVPNTISNRDSILDFGVTEDAIWLDDSAFVGIGALGGLGPSRFVIGTAATDAQDRILYNQSNGFLYFDRDGSGTSFQPVLFAQVTAGLALTAADFLVI